MEIFFLNRQLCSKFGASLFFICLLSFILIANTSLAKTWYVKPSSEIPLRIGKGTDYRILAIVADGEKVTIVKEADSWVKVLTEEGKKGWLLKRYLTRKKPLQILVETLQNENSSLVEKVTILQSKTEELTSLNNALQKTIDNNKHQLTSTASKYENLVKDNADVITIKNNLTQSKKSLTNLQKKLSTLSAENNRLKASQNIRWFLAGGGTLILGFIFGIISAKSKKRKPSLY